MKLFARPLVAVMMSAISAAGMLIVAPKFVLAADLVAGQVTKVDVDSGKITIKHGPFKKFDMDHGMTMVFKAGDPSMLKQVKAGDRIKFDAEKINGQFTVTKLEKSK